MKVKIYEKMFYLFLSICLVSIEQRGEFIVQRIYSYEFYCLWENCKGHGNNSTDTDVLITSCICCTCWRLLQSSLMLIDVKEYLVVSVLFEQTFWYISFTLAWKSVELVCIFELEIQNFLTAYKRIICSFTLNP